MMKQDLYKQLLKEFPSIAKVVNTFKSEAVQDRAFEALIHALGLDSTQAPTSVPVKHKTNLSRTQKKAKGPAKKDADDPASTNYMDIVNTLKNRNDFTAIENHILHKRDLWNKICLVFYIARTELTSGEINNILRALNVKTDISSVSRKLDEKRGSWMSDSVRKKGATPRYKLSGPASGTFQKWFDETLK